MILFPPPNIIYFNTRQFQLVEQQPEDDLHLQLLIFRIQIPHASFSPLVNQFTTNLHQGITVLSSKKFFL